MSVFDSIGKYKGILDVFQFLNKGAQVFRLVVEQETLGITNEEKAQNVKKAILESTWDEFEDLNTALKDLPDEKGEAFLDSLITTIVRGIRIVNWMEENKKPEVVEAS